VARYGGCSFGSEALILDFIKKTRAEARYARGMVLCCASYCSRLLTSGNTTESMAREGSQSTVEMENGGFMVSWERTGSACV